ncbi:hypothetical protein PMZ80_001619 [Knufia obscura]|uniref:Mid2 domain-containing protein n=1 Tax=Knufia obscura TaxID=1635080 RepID=A0ABR0S540_9EURO|nr:hypothetical protein PMZ80_001619 [Knufia obscura]
MIRLLTFLLPLFFALLRPASAQNDSTAAFVVPDTWAAGRTKLDRPVYQIGSTLEVQWTTTDDEYRVILCHISNLTTYSATRGSTIYTKALSDTENDGFNWTVDDQTFGLEINVFLLAFQPLDTTLPLNESAYSQYFNLTTEAISTSTTSSATIVESAPPSATAPPPSETTSPNSSPEPSSSPVAEPISSGLSSGASIGLGVGVGIGGVAIIILAYLAFVRYRKRKAEGTGGGTTTAYHPAPTAYNVHGHGTKSEMAVYEAPAVSPYQQSIS